MTKQPTKADLEQELADMRAVLEVCRDALVQFPADLRTVKQANAVKAVRAILARVNGAV